jgi:hypothetical protein
MRKCFVMQPFDKGEFDKRYDDVFAPAVKNAGLEPYRVDRDLSVSIPIQRIEENIREFPTPKSSREFQEFQSPTRGGVPKGYAAESRIARRAPRPRKLRVILIPTTSRSKRFPSRARRQGRNR